MDEVKASKMKELVLKKRSELEDICRKTHMLPVSDSAIDQTIVAIESGIVDATLVLEHLEQHISKIKEEALSRKEILEKVEKWLSACDEESWLEEYNRVRVRITETFVMSQSSLYFLILQFFFSLYRMITVTMLDEELILLSSGLRKLVILLTNFQVSYSLLTNAYALKRL